jgi:hypothetical protein
VHLRECTNEQYKCDAAKIDRSHAHMKRAKAKQSKDTPAAQHARFVKAASEAEADESPEALDKAFKKLALITKKASGRPS